MVNFSTVKVTIEVLITMVTAAVDYKGMENSRDTSKSHYAGVACNVRLLYWEEDMAKGGCDSSGPCSIFLPSKKPNLKSGHTLFFMRMLRDSWSRMAALSAGAARRKLEQRLWLSRHLTNQIDRLH